ncbi:MAG: helix-turn-helix transcriptional regulator [Pseudonocardiaceae bacterium]
MEPSPTGDDLHEEPPGVAALTAVAALSDPFRRRLYRFIRRSLGPVNREQAAANVGISRKLAAFHLDKLVEVGLLHATHERVGQVRKVGRTPKIYQPTQAVVRISIPEHQHDLLAEILLDAVLNQRADENIRQAALRLARQRGDELGAAERARVRPGRLGAERALTLTEGVLARYGFEPARDNPTTVRLRNCPFHPLTPKAPELVCAINHAFLTGFLHGLQATTVQAVLAPHPPECCVRLCTQPATDDPDGTG